jgi:hypothetical protein
MEVSKGCFFSLSQIAGENEALPSNNRFLDGRGFIIPNPL